MRYTTSSCQFLFNLVDGLRDIADVAHRGCIGRSEPFPASIQILIHHPQIEGVTHQRNFRRQFGQRANTRNRRWDVIGSGQNFFVSFFTESGNSINLAPLSLQSYSNVNTTDMSTGNCGNTETKINRQGGILSTKQDTAEAVFEIYQWIRLNFAEYPIRLYEG